VNNLQRIAGADYFYSIMKALDSEGGRRVFFMGSTENVLELIKQKVAREYPGIEGVGVFSPPFGDWSDEDNKHIIQVINDFKPDALWVGMTAPKQEKWVSSNRGELNVPIIGSIGAVFDFYAGTHPRAPEWMHKNGLEWLYRLVREPRRMWRRNFVSTPKFIWLMLLDRIKT
jgi:N-acetylglucosaminyldiphosphoundecaprenol N-acetyl-beta-D-mannosaminyltransferase